VRCGIFSQALSLRSPRVCAHWGLRSEDSARAPATPLLLSNFEPPSPAPPATRDRLSIDHLVDERTEWMSATKWPDVIHNGRKRMTAGNDNGSNALTAESIGVTRRKLLQSATATMTVALLGPASGLSAAAGMRIDKATTISWQPDIYHGWPTLTRRRNGELLVVCSGGRKSHVDPFGQVELIRSRDNGRTWTWPRIVLDGPLDDRDAGVLETRKGTLLITTFTSLAYEPILARAESLKPGAPGAWSKEKLAAWQAARDRLTEAERKAQLGDWMIRSTDGGLTWSAPYDSLVNSPHGPIELSDGRLLYAGKQLWKEGERVGVCESNDDGKTWRW